MLNLSWNYEFADPTMMHFAQIIELKGIHHIQFSHNPNKKI